MGKKLLLTFTSTEIFVQGNKFLLLYKFPCWNFLSCCPPVKVDVPKSNIAMIWTSMFEWYMDRCESKDRNQKDMYLKEIGLRAQNMLTILGSIIVIVIVGTYMTN